MSLQAYLDIARQAADIAAKTALARFGHTTAQYKEAASYAGSIVTEADRETERALLAFLSEAVPGHAIVGEETGRHGEAEWCWYLDPIDGTANYARGSETWGINIGLARNGEPVVGVITYPSRGYTLHGAKGLGAWRGQTRLSVSDRPLARALLHSGGVHGGRIVVTREIAEHVADIRVVGAGSVSFGEIAQGLAEIYNGGPSDHDICAGCVLVREAGGRVLDMSGQEWRIGSEDLLVVTPTLREEVLALLRIM